MMRMGDLCVCSEELSYWEKSMCEWSQVDVGVSQTCVMS